MPPRTRKRKASAVATNETEEPAPKKTTTRAPRRAPQQKRKTTVADSLPDETRQSPDPTKKRRVNISETKRQLHTQRDDLIKFIEEQSKIEPSSFDKTTVLGQDVLSDLTSVLPWLAEPSKTEAQNLPEPPLHAAAKAAMAEFQGILDAYEKMNKLNRGIKRPAWMRWNQDGKDLAELNQHAMAFATQTVNQTIMPGPHPAPRRPPEHGGDISTMAWELMEEGKPKETEETWGSVAQGQVMAFTRILKVMPNERGKTK